MTDAEQNWPVGIPVFRDRNRYGDPNTLIDVYQLQHHEPDCIEIAIDNGDQEATIELSKEQVTALASSLVVWLRHKHDEATRD